MDGCTEYRWPLLFYPGSSFRSRTSLGDGTGNGPMISLRPSLITAHRSVSSLSDPAREASPCSRYLRPARNVDTTCTVRRNVHELLATKVKAHRTPNLLRGCVGRSHVDHTEARNDLVGCFGRSSRSARHYLRRSFVCQGQDHGDRSGRTLTLSSNVSRASGTSPTPANEGRDDRAHYPRA